MTPSRPPLLQRLLGFRTRLYLTWAALFALFASFFLSFDLKFSIILDKLPNLVGLHLAPNGFLQGAALTLFLCLCSMLASSVLGFITALGRLSKSAVAFGIASFYASFFRGTPLLVQLFLIYYGLPQVGIELDPIPAALIGFSLNMAAYACEILRAAIASIERGQ
ncbi:amino acid ABC transporter permease, partial [Corynebacterium pseudodiphtheriticum]